MKLRLGRIESLLSQSSEASAFPDKSSARETKKEFSGFLLFFLIVIFGGVLVAVSYFDEKRKTLEAAKAAAEDRRQLVEVMAERLAAKFRAASLQHGRKKSRSESDDDASFVNVELTDNETGR